MNKHTRRTPAKKNLLPFNEWVEKNYPENTKSRQLLRVIGALDLVYLLYRAGLIEHKEEVPKHEIAPIRRAIRKTASVKSTEEQAEEVKPKRTRKPARRTGTRKKKAELALEFEHVESAPLPDTRSGDDVDPEPVPEPEPLMLGEETPAKAPADTGSAWLGDEQLEDADPRKSAVPLGIGGITVGFDYRDIDDEREALLVVDDIPYRISLASPPMNLGRMLQIMRVSYGELYVLGRAALGAISGEGYISADEAERIVRALKHVGTEKTDLDISYFAKDAKTRSRTSAILRVRFEPV